MSSLSDDLVRALGALQAIVRQPDTAAGAAAMRTLAVSTLEALGVEPGVPAEQEAPNRWRGFSTHELAMIARAIAPSVSSVGVGEPSRLVVEIRAELERRGRER